MDHSPMDGIPTWLSTAGINVLGRLALYFRGFLALFISLWD